MLPIYTLICLFSFPATIWTLLFHYYLSLLFFFYLKGGNIFQFSLFWKMSQLFCWNKTCLMWDNFIFYTSVTSYSKLFITSIILLAADILSASGRSRNQWVTALPKHDEKSSFSLTCNFWRASRQSSSRALVSLLFLFPLFPGEDFGGIAVESNTTEGGCAWLLVASGGGGTVTLQLGDGVEEYRGE